MKRPRGGAINSLAQNLRDRTQYQAYFLKKWQAFPGQGAEAISKLGLLLGCVGKAVIETAIETGGSATGSAQSDESGDLERHSDSLCNSGVSTGGRRNSFSEKALGDVVQRNETPKDSRAARTRTGNQRIMSPLL
jgi:hypothetical protein